MAGSAFPSYCAAGDSAPLLRTRRRSLLAGDARGTHTEKKGSSPGGGGWGVGERIRRRIGGRAIPFGPVRWWRTAGAGAPRPTDLGVNGHRKMHTSGQGAEAESGPPEPAAPAGTPGGRRRSAGRRGRSGRTEHLGVEMHRQLGRFPRPSPAADVAVAAWQRPPGESRVRDREGTQQPSRGHGRVRSISTTRLLSRLTAGGSTRWSRAECYLFCRRDVRGPP